MGKVLPNTPVEKHRYVVFLMGSLQWGDKGIKPLPPSRLVCVKELTSDLSTRSYEDLTA